jgi:hypothetical protein
MSQTWDAFNDFYFSDQSPAGGSSFSYPVTNPDPGIWGYYSGNLNGPIGFNGVAGANSVGTFLQPNQLIDLTAPGPYVGPGIAYGVITAYNDNYPSGSGVSSTGNNVIGNYASDWFSGAPGWGAFPPGTPNTQYLFLQPVGVQNSDSSVYDGFGAILTFTAPTNGTYSFSGSYVTGNSGQPTDIGIVDSRGNTLFVSKGVATMSQVFFYSFNDTLIAGQSVQFQVGDPTPYNGTPAGLSVTVTLVNTWNAFNDFYYSDPTPTGGGSNPYPTNNPDPGIWGYYSGDFNGPIGFNSGAGANGVGTFLESSQLIDLTVPGPYVGLGQAQNVVTVYNDNYSSGSGVSSTGWCQVGGYTSDWYGGAPGWGAFPPSTANTQYLYLQPAGVSNPDGSIYDGFGAVLTFTAPATGNYNFSGSYVTGNSDQPTDIGIVDNNGTILYLSNYVGTLSQVISYSANDFLTAGQSVQFQVGDPTPYNGTPVGLSVVVTNNSIPNVGINAPLIQYLFNGPATAPVINSTSLTTQFNPALVTAGVSASSISLGRNIGCDTAGTATGLSYPTDPVLQIYAGATNVDNSEAAAGTPVTTGAAAVAANSYFTFALAANSGNFLNLSNLQFDVARGGNGTPRGFVIQSSMDGFSSDLAGPTDVPTVRPMFTHYSIDLSGVAFQGITNIAFRIFTYSIGVGNTVEYDNFAVYGSTSVAPPRILPAYVSAGSSLTVLVNTLIGHNYLLESTTNLNPPVVWSIINSTAGTGETVTNGVALVPAQPNQFFRYLVQ